MNDRYVLLTGATGFIGHHLLHELLKRGRDCAITLRPPIEPQLARLARLLRPLGTDLETALDSGDVVPIACDLIDRLPPRSPVRIVSVLHAAASTRFDSDGTGEPTRTNVHGTQRLLEWSRSHGVRDFHFVSSAFACGHVGYSAESRFDTAEPAFHNEYERSKWIAEQLLHEAASRARHPATIYRPSIVVGSSDAGRASKYDGFYVTVRATELLHRAYRDRPRSERHSIPLRIKGRPGDHQNIVSVDYVAAMIAAIFADPTLHGRTYHLVNPHPPTNALIKSALEEHFDIGGGRFVDPEAFARAELDDTEKLFHDVSRPVEHYFVDSPRFERGRTADIERALGIACPRYDVAALRQLFAAAIACKWGKAGMPGRSRTTHAGSSGDEACPVYFEQFLPDRIPLSRIARMTAMDVKIRFIIEDQPRGDWLCAFERGQLTHVSRAAPQLSCDFGYRADLKAFWRAISGAAHPQEFFLRGRADIFGDVARALKMAMILNAFSREHPCDRQTLLNLRRHAC
jgi:nucleoside-diphosphate-sugar epimerase